MFVTTPCDLSLLAMHLTHRTALDRKRFDLPAPRRSAGVGAPYGKIKTQTINPKGEISWQTQNKEVTNHH
jgi:hypothetical protein